MRVLIEGELQIAVHDAIRAWKFDGPSHGLSPCMKAVDFVVDLQDRYLYIEIENLQRKTADAESAAEYLRRLEHGNIEEVLKYKFRDSFLYE